MKKIRDELKRNRQESGINLEKLTGIRDKFRETDRDKLTETDITRIRDKLRETHRNQG